MFPDNCLGYDPIINGYKELEDVMNEIKEWKTELKMEVQICNKKGNFLMEKMVLCNATKIVLGSNITSMLGNDTTFPCLHFVLAQIWVSLVI